MKSDAPKMFDKMLRLTKAIDVWICNAMILKSNWAYKKLILPKLNLIGSIKQAENANMQKTKVWKNPESTSCV